MRYSFDSSVRVVLLIFGVFVMLFFVVRGTANAADDAGAALYKSKCALCHGPDGAGQTPTGKNLKLRDLRSPEVQKQTDAELTEITTKGKNKMPGYEKQLKPDQIKDLVAHIRMLAKK